MTRENASTVSVAEESVASATEGRAPAGSVSTAGERRIAVMLPRFSRYGGAEQFGFRLAEGLARRGHAVDFICARKEIEPPAGVRVLEVGRPPGVRSLKMLWYLVRAEALRRRGGYALSISLGKSWKQDVSRMGGGPLGIFWERSELAVPKGLPRLVKRLKRRLKPSNWLTLFVEKHQFTGDSEVIAVSHLVRDWLLEAHADLDPAKVRVIYNRPDETRFFPPDSAGRKAAREALLAGRTPALPGHEPVLIGTATTNFELKGVGPLIRAMSLLPENTILFVAGGRDHRAYSRLARQAGVADRVVFCGKVNDMPAFYRALDVFILPTFYDACSNAVLEALASGCKVLTSSSNGASYFLADRHVFPDPGDAPELARRLLSSMVEPPPPPFVWPSGVPSGLEAFIGCVEARLGPERACGSGNGEGGEMP